MNTISLEKTEIKIKIRNKTEYYSKVVKGYKAFIEDVPVVIHRSIRYPFQWVVSEPTTGLSASGNSVHHNGSTRKMALESAMNELKKASVRQKGKSFKELLEMRK